LPSHIIYCIFILNLSVISLPLLSQDSTGTNIKKDSLNLQEILVSENKYRYVDISAPDTISRNRMLWYPLKSLEDIFIYLPGYYLNFMDVGQVNRLNFDRLDQHYTGLFRNEHPLNDLFDGSIDFNLFSKNEIAAIEQTGGFGNFLYNYNNGLNVISRQIFRNRPYSEISYTQDRSNNLFFDGDFHQNIFKYFNFNFGITKQSYDGYYLNSSFDKWLGRLNLNYFPSKSFNISLNTNYAKINRGLNEGIDPSQIPDLNKTTLFETALDLVRKPDANESKERFDIDLAFLKTYGKKKDSFTKLQFFTSNSFRKYGATGYLYDSTSYLIRDNNHWIDYGVKLHQTLSLNLYKGLDLISRTELEYDKDYLYSTLNPLNNSERIYFIEDAVFNTKFLSLDAFAKAYRHAYFENKFFYDYGIKPVLKFEPMSDLKLRLFAQYSNSSKLPTYEQLFIFEKYIYPSLMLPLSNEKNQLVNAGVSLQYKQSVISAEYYHNNIKNFVAVSDLLWMASSSFKDDGLNTALKLNIFHFELEGDFSYSFNKGTYRHYFSNLPQYFGNIMFAYHDLFFKNKLELRGGIVSRFWDDFTSSYYNGYYNDFSERLLDTAAYSSGSLTIKRNATLDLFVIAKIDKAVFGLTLENILNRPLMTTAIYPYQQRGGLFNVISRFNITWYFLN
jgi:hypothetical protein